MDPSQIPQFLYQLDWDNDRHTSLQLFLSRAEYQEINMVDLRNIIMCFEWDEGKIKALKLIQSFNKLSSAFNSNLPNILNWFEWDDSRNKVIAHFCSNSAPKVALALQEKRVWAPIQMLTPVRNIEKVEIGCILSVGPISQNPVEKDIEDDTISVGPSFPPSFLCPSCNYPCPLNNFCMQCGTPLFVTPPQQDSEDLKIVHSSLEEIRGRNLSTITQIPGLRNQKVKVICLKQKPTPGSENSRTIRTSTEVKKIYCLLRGDLVTAGHSIGNMGSVGYEGCTIGYDSTAPKFSDNYEIVEVTL